MEISKLLFTLKSVTKIQENFKYVPLFFFFRSFILFEHALISTSNLKCEKLRKTTVYMMRNVASKKGALSHI